MVVQLFEASHDLRMQSDFFKECVADLVILDDAEDADFVHSFDQHLAFQVCVLVKFSH